MIRLHIENHMNIYQSDRLIGTAAVPAFTAGRYFHELVKLLHVNIAAFPLHEDKNINTQNTITKVKKKK